MTGEVIERRSQLCEQADPRRLTGIDFIQVVDPAVQTELLVFFVVDPTIVMLPSGNSMVDATATPLPDFDHEIVAIADGGGEQLARLTPSATKWEIYHFGGSGGSDRTVLRLTFAEPGDFSNYRLHIDHPAIDRFFNGVLFSFKQGCESGFDCLPELRCPPFVRRDVEIDYLARDFESLNSALGDFAARYYPEWGERTTADMGVMVTELFAALGDEFAFIQDSFSREAYLETATQRRSLMRHARLVDYVPDPGRNASCLLSLEVKLQSAATTLEFADRLPFWAVPEGKPPIPFELGDSLHDEHSLLVHSDWNTLPLYLPDPGEPCLPAGATEALLAPLSGNVLAVNDQQVTPAAAKDIWKGRTVILQSVPAEPGLPMRAWPVTIAEIEVLDDPLNIHFGSPAQLVRIAWAAAEALPHSMRIAETTVLGNVAIATAGKTFSERFHIGPEKPAVPSPRAVEREGPARAGCSGRPTVMLFGLKASEANGLNHCGEHGFFQFRVPDIRLVQDPDGARTLWGYKPSLLKADGDDPEFTLDPGIWREIIGFERQGEIYRHADYAASHGYTIRFGDGEFGRTPGDGAEFEVTYRTLLGARSNVASGAVSVVAPPDGSPTNPGLADVVGVTNPLAASGGVSPESAVSVRQNAPEFSRAFPLNAIRDEHFVEIVEREDWVQRAGSRSRWTGSWLSHFIAADPKDAFSYSSEQRRDLDDLTDAVRMAGREVILRDPRFVPIDLEITVCIEEGHFSGDIRKSVIAQLTECGPGGGPPFFDPDNFTFGKSLSRTRLEAAVQAVPGVKGVTAICCRRRGTFRWQPIAEADLRIASNEILRMDNNPLHPDRGSLAVRVGETAAQTGCACCTP